MGYGSGLAQVFPSGDSTTFLSNGIELLCTSPVVYRKTTRYNDSFVSLAFLETYLEAAYVGKPYLGDEYTAFFARELFIVHALVVLCLQWRTAISLAVPPQATDGKGCFIPKSSTPYIHAKGSIEDLSRVLLHLLGAIIKHPLFQSLRSITNLEADNPLTYKDDFERMLCITPGAFSAALEGINILQHVGPPICSVFPCLKMSTLPTLCPLVFTVVAT